jgi:RNA polymerase sigma factor (sigma-70 family)
VAAEPSIGRATRVERPFAPGADAAGALYERYSAQIHGYCLHQLGSREEAEDAVQTTFMNAFRGLSRGIVPELESAWLFKIAHNVCLSRRRSSWRRGNVEAPNNFEVLQEVIPGREQVADELIGLQDVLEKMPENQRRAILLREWQGLTYREISAELGLSQAAVETLIFRARRALAQGLEQDADTWKRRLRRGADVGGAIAFVKALLGGGGAAAVKIAVTAIAVATTAVTAATEGPRPAHRVHAAKPAAAATRHITRHTTATIASIAAGTAPLGHPSSARLRRQSALPDRSLPKPVALPASQPEVTISAAAPAQPSSTPEAPPAPAPSRPEPAVASAAAAPSTPALALADHGHGNGKGNKDDRTTQATTQPTETTPAPPASPADQPAQQSDQGHGNGKRDGNANARADAKANATPGADANANARVDANANARADANANANARASNDGTSNKAGDQSGRPDAGNGNGKGNRKDK